MTILDVVEKLRTVLESRVQRGSLSVGLLARQSSLTKSHISKFLHAEGNVSIAAMHRIMESQQVDAKDLIQLSPHLPARAERTQFVPMVTHRPILLEPSIGPGAVERWLPFSPETLDDFEHSRVRSRQSWRRFVALRLKGEEARKMDTLANEGSVIVIDRHYETVRSTHSERKSLYAVLDGRELIVGYAYGIGAHLVVQPPTAAMPARVIYLEPSGDAGKYIIGRVVMILNVFH